MSTLEERINAAKKNGDKKKKGSSSLEDRISAAKNRSYAKQEPVSGPVGDIKPVVQNHALEPLVPSYAMKPTADPLMPGKNGILGNTGTSSLDLPMGFVTTGEAKAKGESRRLETEDQEYYAAAREYRAAERGIKAQNGTAAKAEQAVKQAEKDIEDVVQKYGGVRTGGGITFPTQQGVDAYNAAIAGYAAAVSGYNAAVEGYGKAADRMTASGYRMDDLWTEHALKKIEGVSGEAGEELKRLRAINNDIGYKVNNLGANGDEVIQEEYAAEGFKTWNDLLRRIEELEHTQGQAAKGYYETSGEGAVYRITRGGENEVLDKAAQLLFQAEEMLAAHRYGGWDQKASRSLTDLYNQIEPLKKQLIAAGFSEEDVNAALEYMVYAQRNEAAAKRAEEIKRAAEEHPGWESVKAIAAAPLQGWDFLNMRASTAGRNDATDLKNYKPASTADMQTTQYVSTVTGTVADKIRGEDPNLLNKAAAFLYQTGMSMGQSIAQVAAFGPASVAIMGASAASSAAYDVIERGGTNNQAFWSGIAAGAAEMIFEKFSVESLLEGVGDSGFWRSVLKQAGIEASEEMATEIANILSDAAIMGHNSKFNTAVREYMTEEGISKEKAKQKAFLDCVADVGLAGLGGALSGGGSMMLRGGGQMAVSKAVNNARENEFMSRHKAAEQVFEEIEGQKKAASGMETVEQDGKPSSVGAEGAATFPQGKAMEESTKTAETGAQPAQVNGERVQAGMDIPEQKTQQKAAEGAKPRAAGVYDTRTKSDAEPLNRVLSDRGVLYLKAVSRATGMRINIVDASDNADGWYENGEIFIAENCADPVNWIATHEVTHHLEQAAPEAYAGYLERVKAILSQEGDLQKMIADKQAYYAENGTTLTEDGALRELAANFTERLMLDENLFNRVAREDRGLAQRILDSLKEFIRRIRTTWSGQEIRQLEATRKAWEKALRESRGKTVEGGERQYLYAGQKSMTARAEETQKEVTARYEKAVDSILNGTGNVRGAVLMGYTPEIYRALGMPQIPFVIGSGHVYSVAKTATEAKSENKFHADVHYHGLGDTAVKKLLEAAQDPVMIISAKDVSPKASPLRSTHSVVSIVEIKTKSASLLLPIEITAERTVDGQRMDVNVLSTAYEKTAKNLITEAIAQENTGDVGVYYIKKEAANLIGAGVQFSKRLQEAASSDGIVHRLDEKVNMNILDQTQSRQFTKWFGDWQNKPQAASKVVDEQGRPLAVYHGTNKSFTVFKSKDGAYWFSESEDYAEAMAAERGGNEIMQVYLNMRKPYRAKLPPGKFSDPSAEAPIIRTAKDGDYDGVIIECDTTNELEKETFYVVFNETQIKSATDNIGTFDRKNPDINYSLRGAREHEQSAAEAQKQGKRLEERAAFQRANVKSAAKPGAGELDKIAGGLLKDFSSQYDRKELTAQLEVLYDKLSKGGLSGKALAAEAESLARRMLTEVSIMGEEGAELRRELRQTKIHVPRALWEDFEEEGGYTGFRQKYMGKLQLSGETGQSIDEVYEDLSVSYPSVFDMDAVEDPVNRLLQIAEVADSLRFVSENLSATDRVNVELLAGEMVERLYDLAQKGQPLSEVRAKDRKAAQDRLRETVAKRERESARKVESIRKSNREANMRQRERMNTTKLRDSVRKHADALARKLTRPTDKQHIPEHLRGSVLALLEVIDLESKFGYQFTREATFKRVNQSEGELLEPTSRTSAARALKAAYEQLRSDPEFSGVVDPDLADMLEEIAGMGNIRVADMNMEQLQTVWNAVRAVEASVTKSDKMLGASKYGKISSAADAMRAELGNREDRKNYVGALGRIDQFFNLDLLTPETFLHRMGKVGEDLNNQLRAAQDRNVEILREGINLYKQAMKDTGVDLLKAEKELHTFELPGGTIELTTAQVMELYALSRRQAAMEHIYEGGLRAQGGRKGLVKTGKSKAVKVTFTDVADIIGVLSKEQKAFVDTLQHYMSSQLAAHGNDASMEAYGYEKFKEKFYWPIKVAPSETDTDAASEAKAKTIPGFGMTKALKPHANNSVVLRSALDSFNEHLNQMATYAAWLTTSENITKLVNYDYMAEGSRTGTVKDLLMKVYGEGGEQYLTTLLSNIAQGTKTGAGKSAITESLFGKWKAAKVGANIRVILQQPTAIIRAAELIDARYLAQVGNPIKGWEKAVEWAPIAQWKDWGYFEMDTGRSMRELTAGTDSKLDKVKNASMWATGKMDNIAWGMLWNAVEAETKAKHADLKVGSDEYYQAVAKRFGGVVNRTQVVDSVLHRTQIMRSSNALNRFATSFMSEPSKVYNMVARDIYDIVNAEKGSEEQKQAWKHVARTGAALVASFMVNALAQSAADALRDDDREKNYGEKFLEAYFGFTGEEEGFGEHWKSFWSGNVTGNLDPLGYIPYVKDVQSVWQGFTVDRPDMEGLADLANAAKTFAKAAAGEGNKTMWNAGLNMALKGLDAIGLPAGNLKRDLMAMYSSVLQWTGAHWMTYQLDKTMLKIGESGNRSVFCATLMRAMNDDYDAYVKIYNDMVKSGMSPEDIKMGMDRQMAAELGLTKLSLLPIDWKAPGKDAAFDKKVKSRIESEKSWEEIVGGEYLGLLRELDALKAEDGKTSATDAQKRRHIADANYSERIKEQAMERVLGFGTAANGRYVKARSAGISTKAFVDLLDAIEAATVARKGEKGSPNQDDVEKALNKSTLTAAQKRAVWYSYGWKSKSPWG